MISALWRGWIRARGYALLPLVVLLLAAAVRLHQLEAQSLWNDEGNSLRLVERTVPDLLEAASRDIHPPGYYLLLKGWHTLAGDSEFSLRFPSALFGILTTACVIALGRALFAPGVGGLAGLVVALNTFSVYYGQEARMYALLQLWAAASLLVLVLWLKRGAPWGRLLLLWGVINAAGLYTHYSYPFVMLVEGVIFVLWALPDWIERRSLRPLIGFILASGLTLLLFGPQLGGALHQITSWPRTGYDVKTSEGLFTMLRWLLIGNIYGVPNQPAAGSVVIWFLIFGLVGLLPDWLRIVYLKAWWRRLVPIMMLIGSLILFLALGLYREANLKFLLPAQVGAALCVGRGIWLLWEIGSPLTFIFWESLPRLVAVFGTVAILSFSKDALSNLYHNPAYARDDYRGVAALITAEGRPGDAIILDAPNQREVFTYYYRAGLPIYPLPPGLGGDDPATATLTSDIIQSFQRIFVLFWGEGERDPNRIVEKTLAANAFEISSAWHGSVRLVRYASMPQMGTPRALNARFGEHITLMSAAISSSTLAPAEVLGVSFQWQTDAPLETRYRVTVQLLNSEGKLINQRDAEPGSNMALTTTWKPGEAVLDTHGLIIPVNTPPGVYTLIVALYDLNNPASRLMVQGADALTLSTVQIGP